MINLATQIRAFIIADGALTNDLSTFNTEKAVFTRRPVPTTATYPMMIVSPQITANDNDYIDGLYRNSVYDIAVYGSNDTAANYRTTENIAFLLQDKFARLRSTDITMPAGWNLVQAITNGPTPFPTDDLTKVARGVTVTFQIFKKD